LSAFKAFKRKHTEKENQVRTVRGVFESARYNGLVSFEAVGGVTSNGEEGGKCRRVNPGKVGIGAVAFWRDST